MLVIRIQPDEGISLTFGAKVPGHDSQIRTVDMEFDYEATSARAPEAYERLLLDCMLGDATLFARSDEIRRRGRSSIPCASRGPRSRPESYEPGMWGPKSADDMPRRDGRTWRLPE